MKLINLTYLNETFDVVLISPGGKCVTESTTVFPIRESVNHNLVLLLVRFMAENAFSLLYVAQKRQIKLRANILSSGIYSHGNDRQNWIMSEEFGAEESS